MDHSILVLLDSCIILFPKLIHFKLNIGSVSSPTAIFKPIFSYEISISLVYFQVNLLLYCQTLCTRGFDTEESNLLNNSNSNSKFEFELRLTNQNLGQIIWNPVRSTKIRSNLKIYKTILILLLKLIGRFEFKFKIWV